MYTMNKKTGIIISIVMIGLGLLAFFDPLALGLGISYVVTAGLGIYGISSIITYFRSKASYRSGWSLANGIVLTLLSGLMLWTALGNPYGSVELLSTLTFAIGFFTLLSGIEQIQAFSALRKASVPGAGPMLTSGIMNLFLTLIILINPLLGWFGLSVIWGLYLTMSGIVLLTESFVGNSTRYHAA